ncbi:RDD family protein [Streptomyces sp. NPDC005435]|uniref:RDD family protein n=1 Tax=Streptomyces sp. NPDC005435 TaxID=3154464 RepID=UPI003454B186
MSYGSPNPYGQPQDPQQGYGRQPPQGVPPQYGYPQGAGVPPQGYGYPQQPGVGYPGGPGPRLASMGRRFGARAIDAVILTVLSFVLSIAGVASFANSVQDCDPASTTYETCVNDAGASMMSKLLPLLLLFGLATLLYEWLMVGLIGATLGKLAVGIRVVQADTGQKPGLLKSFLRWIIPTAAGYVSCGIGQLLVYLSPFWDNSGRQQGWHDKVAGTLVVHKD